MSILKREDGQMVGCAFVHYSTKTEALKAIKECNMKSLLGKFKNIHQGKEGEKFSILLFPHVPSCFYYCYVVLLIYFL